MERVSLDEYRRRIETEAPPSEDLLPELVRLERDVVFTETPERPLKLDLTLAEGAAEPGAGMVFVHGGGWRGGDKAQFARQAAWLAARYGIASACCEYRFSREARFPACLHDVKCAVRYLRSRADELGIDAARIGIAGGSAGGHLAAMVATTAGVAEYEGDGGDGGDGGYGEFPSDVALCVPHNGACDLVERARTSEAVPQAVADLLGGTIDELPDLWRDASPYFRAGASSPPFLLMHGDADETVSCEQSRRMHEKLLALGVHSELEVFPGVGHGWFNHPPHFGVVLSRMERFLVERFGL